MDIDIVMRTRRCIDLPHTLIPSVAIHWSRWSKRKHRSIEEGVACWAWQPVEKTAYDIGWHELNGHMLSVINPHLFAMVTGTVNCQVMAIRREFHRQNTIRLLKPKPIAEMSNDLGSTEWLTTISSGSTGQDKTIRLFECVVDVGRYRHLCTRTGFEVSLRPE